MASQATVKRHVDPDIFKDFLKRKNTSIRQLGSSSEVNEKTIRRMLQTQEVTLNVALDLCKHFNCTFDDIFGPDDRPEWTRSKNDIIRRVC